MFQKVHIIEVYKKTEMLKLSISEFILFEKKTIAMIKVLIFNVTSLQ